MSDENLLPLHERHLLTLSTDGRMNTEVLWDLFNQGTSPIHSLPALNIHSPLKGLAPSEYRIKD